MNILVIGGTGTVGSQLVSELVNRKVSVRVLSRQLGKKRAGVQYSIGDLEQPESLIEAFHGIDAAFLLTGMSQTETLQGLTAVEFAKKAGVRKLVYLSTPMDEHLLHIPHIKSKIPVEEAIKQSGMDFTILRPNNFFQNDIWFRDAIMQYGVYPQPLGSVGLHRVDVSDIAHAAANALLIDGFEGKEYPLNGPDLLTGEAIAQAYSKHTGLEIQYSGDNLEAWYQQAIKDMPEWMANDYRIMYESFQQFGCLATDADFKHQQKLLMREPRSFDSFVEETVARWNDYE